MNALRELRKQLGFTQTQLAGLLGVNEGQVSMAEGGRRQLPVEAMHTITQLKMGLQQLPQTNIPVVPDGKIKTDLARLIRIKERELRGLQLKLEKLEDKLDALRRLLGLAAQPEMETLLPKDSEQSDHWKLIVRKAHQKFSQLFSEVIRLKINISGLEAALKIALSEEF